MSGIAFDITDLVPAGEGLPDTSADAEASRWVFSFLTVDTRGREIGRDFIKMGVPTLIKTRPYIARNDEAQYEGKSQDPLAVGRNLAGPAVKVLEGDYGIWGLREIPAFKGMDSRADIETVAAVAFAVLPDPYAFDDAADPDKDLCARRRAYLQRKAREAPEGSLERAYAEVLISANDGTAAYVRDFFAGLSAEAMKKRLHGDKEGGRVSLSEDEERMMAWVGLSPSKYFEGYDRGDTPAASPTLSLPAEFLEALAGASSTKDERIAVLEAELAAMRGDMKALLAAATERRGPGRPPKAQPVAPEAE